MVLYILLTNEFLNDFFELFLRVKGNRMTARLVRAEERPVRHLTASDEPQDGQSNMKDDYAAYAEEAYI